jgi:hypothetical protein
MPEQLTKEAVEKMTEAQAYEAWDRLLDELEDRALQNVDLGNYIDDEDEERAYALLSRRIFGHCRNCGVTEPKPCLAACVTNTNPELIESGVAKTTK